MIHLIKLSVGSTSVESLIDWQQAPGRARLNGLGYHLTRMWPKRGPQLLQGGSIYWVIQGQIQARQQVRDLVEVIGEDGIRRCAIVLDPAVIRVAPTQRRPFQGWRYLDPKDAPPDLPQPRDGEDLPPHLSAALAEIGLV